MSYTIINVEKINLDILMKISNIFNLDKIETNYYENILEVYDSEHTDSNNNEKIVGVVNYCLIPSMKGQTRLFIRNLYFLDKNNFDNIIKSLCKYCTKNNLSIKTTFDNNKFDNECKKILYDNNFKGDDVLYYIN